MSKHATRKVGDNVEWTGARDEDGTPVLPTPEDHARLGGKAFLEYQERAREAKQEAEKKRLGEERFKQFRERFVEAGGNPQDAKSAYQAKQNAEATERAYRRAEAGQDAARRQINYSV